MTIQELIKSGDKQKIVMIVNQMQEINRKDINQKVMVIKIYLICKAIAVIALGIMIIKIYS